MLHFSLFTTLVFLHGIIFYNYRWISLQRLGYDFYCKSGKYWWRNLQLLEAEAFNRNDLILPAILVGSLGNALGTYLDFLLYIFSKN